jgi:hypothetical protein
MFISEYTSFDSATVLYPVLCPGYDIHTYISSEAVTTFTDTAYHIKCIVPGTKDIYILILACQVGSLDLQSHQSGTQELLEKAGIYAVKHHLKVANIFLNNKNNINYF